MKIFHRLPALPVLVLSLLVGITLSLAHAPFSYAEEENQTETPALTTEQTAATEDAAAIGGDAGFTDDKSAGEEQAVVPAELSYAMEMAELTPGDDFESDPWESFNEKMFW
ncbi:MAG TPA: hypothetical protein VLX11_12540, partial [Candidatus Acidoferrales bacterium]|nr:hypothetical protein [Candidatus Acidoferrales bacterium]